jgi:hypothetical protein
MIDLVDEVRNKRELVGLPDSVVKRSLEKVGDDSVKEVRRDLRKYFGVFLTNRVLKPKDIMDYESVLKVHKSSGKRDYFVFYEKIKEGLGVGGRLSVVDLGCGVNGFSYSYMKDVFGNIRYVGLEASRQLVDNANVFFEKSGFGEECEVVHGDLFDIDFVNGILKSGDKPRVVFLFQVVDALEGMEKNFSKKLLLEIKKNSEYVVVSMPLVSLSGKAMRVKRNWVVDFLKENFEVRVEFEENGEMVFCLKC